MIFNKAMPLQAAHMLVAAYVVGGFLSPRCTPSGCCGAGATATTGSASSSRSRSRAIAIAVQMVVGDSLARWVYDNQPMKFAAIELVPKTSSDVPETLFGHLNSDGEVVGGHPDPRPRVDPVGSDGRARPRSSKGLDAFPEDRSADDPARSTSCTWRGT